MKSGALYNGICIISSPLIYFPDRIFIGPESDHCLTLLIKFFSWSLVEILKLICWSYIKVTTLVKELIPLGPFGPLQGLKMAKGTTDPSDEISWKKELPEQDTNKIFWQEYCKVLVYVQSLSLSCRRTWLAIAKQSVYTSLSSTISSFGSLEWQLKKQGQIGLERSRIWSLIPIHGPSGSRGSIRGPRGSGIGLQGPRRSRGRPTGSQGVNG